MEYINQYERWCKEATDHELAVELSTLDAVKNDDAIKDAFYCDLQFGTAGLRGIIGAGTNRMNIYTVGRATQGFADYLNANFESPTVVIARDSRNKGKEFVECAASVFAANGIKVHVFPRIEPTPVLSYAVRYLSCAGGVCMTASHNPAAYNGYKAYGPDGCQIATSAANQISEAIAKVDTFTDVLNMEYDTALQTGKVELIDDALLDSYMDEIMSLSLSTTEDKVEDIKVVYTPLNGAGMECAEALFDRLGIENVVVVPEQRNPDGDFPTCPYPNPETKEALAKGIDLAVKEQADVLIASDPDADRLGVAVIQDGKPILLTGNEIGILMLDYIARKKAATADMSSGIAVSTIVSTDMIDDIATEYGFEIIRTLTGFKYIGSVITNLEKQNEENRFIFGFEESFGYLSGTHVRDKDALNAMLLVCEMVKFHKRNNNTLVDAISTLYNKYGYYLNKTVSFEYPGATGADRMNKIMAALRKDSPNTISGRIVVNTIDYQTGINDLPSANVIQFELEDGCKIIVRPSGTEPKIKTYIFAYGKSKEAVTQAQNELVEGATKLLD